MPKPPAPPPANPAAAPTDAPPTPRIKELAKLPRGKAWASRLCVFEDAIRARRKARQSYRAIAAWLDTQGLRVSASSVHGFVKARARRKRPLYELPEPPAATPAAPAPSAEPPAPAAADPLDFDAPGGADGGNPFKRRQPRQAS